ncbi:MAG: BatA domain-containing protein, partial [Limisphaerales bacterium]
MSFLSPLFLLGVFAIAGPIVFHLIRRATREKILFSSLMFLQPSPPRLTRKSRMEHWFLLMLRCLALILLALAFARPYFANDQQAQLEADEQVHHALLIDTSASMRREGLWEQTLEHAQRWLDQWA